MSSSTSPLNSSIDGLDTRRSPNNTMSDTEQQAARLPDQSTRNTAPPLNPPQLGAKFAKEMHHLLRELERTNPITTPSQEGAVVPSIEPHSPIQPLSINEKNKGELAPRIIHLFTHLISAYARGRAEMGMETVRRGAQDLENWSDREKTLLGILAAVTRALAVVGGVRVGEGYERVRREVARVAVERRVEFNVAEDEDEDDVSEGEEEVGEERGSSGAEEAGRMEGPEEAERVGDV